MKNSLLQKKETVMIQNILHTTLQVSLPDLLKSSVKRKTSM